MKYPSSFVAFVTLSAIATATSAQKSFLYSWKFTDASIQTTVPTCTRLAITIKPGDGVKGTPPYYMTALTIDGTPSTTLIGTKDSDVSYIVDQSVGTRILFSVTDANGNPGGTLSPMDVVAGASTTCITTASTTPTFTMASNATSEISTCQPIGFRINGGVSPYTVSLIAAHSPSVTNVTLPTSDNVFTYVNRAAPGGHLVVAVSDSTGHWASGAALFSTQGTTDTECPGMESSSSFSSAPPASLTATSSVVTSTKPGPSSTASTNGTQSSTSTSTSTSTSPAEPTGSTVQGSSALSLHIPSLLFTAAVVVMSL